MIGTTTVMIEKVCDVRLDDTVQTLQIGKLMTLPTAKARKLIDAGYAKPHPPSAEDYRSLVKYIGESDPGGACWSHINCHHSEMWVHHRQAFDSGNLNDARSTYDEMVSIWAARNRMTQPGLLAA